MANEDIDTDRIEAMRVIECECGRRRLATRLAHQKFISQIERFVKKSWYQGGQVLKMWPALKVLVPPKQWPTVPGR